MKDIRDAGLEYYWEVTQSPYLHYGYWNGSLSHELSSLVAAQECFVNEVIKAIPLRTKSILDIGCGPGGVAKKLADLGFAVTALTPQRWQADLASSFTGAAVPIVVSTYEKFESPNTYDVALMCESSQYIGLEDCFSKSKKLCNEQGHLVVADYFRRNVANSRSNQSGHEKTAFLTAARHYGFELDYEVDITENVIPTLDIAKKSYLEIVKPTIKYTLNILEHRITSKNNSDLVAAMVGSMRSQLEQELHDYETILDSAEFQRTKTYLILRFRARRDG